MKTIYFGVSPLMESPIYMIFGIPWTQISSAMTSLASQVHGRSAAPHRTHAAHLKTRATSKTDRWDMTLKILGKIPEDPHRKSRIPMVFPHRIRMYAIYGNICHQYTPVLLAYISYMDPSWVPECLTLTSIPTTSRGIFSSDRPPVVDRPSLEHPQPSRVFLWLQSSISEIFPSYS